MCFISPIGANSKPYYTFNDKLCLQYCFENMTKYPIFRITPEKIKNCSTSRKLVTIILPSSFYTWKHIHRFKKQNSDCLAVIFSIFRKIFKFWVHYGECHVIFVMNSKKRFFKHFGSIERLYLNDTHWKF